MSPKSIRTALSMSIVVPALAVFLGAGSAAAADQNAAAHHVRSAHYQYPRGIAPGLYGYAPGYGPAPYVFGYGPGYTTNHDAWMNWE